MSSTGDADRLADALTRFANWKQPLLGVISPRRFAAHADAILESLADYGPRPVPAARYVIAVEISLMPGTAPGSTGEVSRTYRSTLNNAVMEHLVPDFRQREREARYGVYPVSLGVVSLPSGPFFSSPPPGAFRPADPGALRLPRPLRRALRESPSPELDRAVLLALCDTLGNESKAAELLGVSRWSVRETRARLQEMALTRPEVMAFLWRETLRARRTDNSRGVSSEGPERMARGGLACSVPTSASR